MIFFGSNEIILFYIEGWSEDFFGVLRVFIYDKFLVVFTQVRYILYFITCAFYIRILYLTILNYNVVYRVTIFYFFFLAY